MLKISYAAAGINESFDDLGETEEKGKRMAHAHAWTKSARVGISTHNMPSLDSASAKI